MYVRHSSLKAHLHVPVCAIPEASLEQLDPDDSKHEEEEDGDEEDVPNVLHSDDHTLHHVLQTLRSVDRSANRRMFQNRDERLTIDGCCLIS